jgi:hypothetical protein
MGNTASGSNLQVQQNNASGSAAICFCLLLGLAHEREKTANTKTHAMPVCTKEGFKILFITFFACKNPGKYIKTGTLLADFLL